MNLDELLQVCCEDLIEHIFQIEIDENTPISRDQIIFIENNMDEITEKYVKMIL